MTNTKSLQQILVLTVAFGVLMSYQFIGAAWTNPPASPPSNNIDAPINVGTTNQIKLGDITAVHHKAGSQMWSPEYCDETGDACFAPSAVGESGLPDCENGKTIIRDGGVWQCAEWPSI